MQQVDPTRPRLSVRHGELGGARAVLSAGLPRAVSSDLYAVVALSETDSHSPFPSVVPASGTDVAAPTPATNIQSPPSEPHPVGMENDTLADRTAAAPEAPEASGSRKRGRDEEDEDEEEDVRVVRQRTNSYEPARGEGLWKTLTKPFRAFVDGFKQSLSTKPESG